MNSEEFLELKKDIEKMKFQIELLSQPLTLEEHPIAVLVNSLDWDRDSLNKAHDIFETYDNMLEHRESINWAQFEKDFNEQLKINYQELKIIILAFYHNSQWVSVCIEYAKNQPCMEFDHILRNEKFKLNHHLF